MTRTLTAALVAACVLALMAPARATSRIKDLANIEGVRQNQLIGYGLVVGLNGTGDTLNNIPFTKQSLQAMLERLGVNIRGAQIRTGNVAAVMVTANLPAFGTQGTRIDVTVSALGDSKSLQGGTLLVTPLLGADGNVYAVAQGSLAVAASRRKATPPRSPAACRPSAASPTAPSSSARSSSRSTGSIRCGSPCAMPTSPPPSASPPRSTTSSAGRSPSRSIRRPCRSRCRRNIHGNLVALLTEIEQLQIEPDLPAKVVIDERSGVIVIGRDVRVSTVAVAQGNLTVTVAETPQVSQPAPFSRGRTVVVPRTRIGVQEDGKKLAVVNEGVSLQQLVDGLNALGIGPLDMIAILQAIKAAGAIQADIEVM